MRSPLGAFATFAWLLTVHSACARDPQELTQVIVAVNADSQVTERLGALQVRLYAADATDLSPPAREQLIVLRSGSATQGVRLPLSFGIQHVHADEFLLVIRGCADPDRCGDAFIEQKAFVRFQPHLSTQVSIVLTAACATPSASCSGLQQTCTAVGSAAGTRGSCGPTPRSVTTVVQPGHEVFPMLPVSIDPTPVPSVVRDASIDAGYEPDAAEPGRDDATDAGQPPACPADNSCRPDVYPCIPDDGTGYVCRGQLADWPMPDISRDGGVPQSYDIDSVPGVARDPVTGLSWQRQTPNSYSGCTGRQSTPGDLCDFQEAVAYCGSLTLAGLRWRIPTKIELESLLDFRPGVPSLDPKIFFYTSERTMYWTSSPPPHADFANKRYTVAFTMRTTSWQNTEVPLAVRCVRSDDRPPHSVTSRYVARPVEGSIGDARTGLLWYPVILCEANLTYAAAEAFCAGLPQRCRVPAAKELLTLIDPTRLPAVDPIFADTPRTGFLWSASLGDETALGRLLMTPGFGLTQVESQVRLQLTEEYRADNPKPLCVRCVQ